MIIDAVIGFFVTMMAGILSFLPTAGSLGLGGFSGIWIGYSQFNTILPLTELLQAIGIFVAAQVLVYGYLAARAIRGWLPFI